MAAVRGRVRQFGLEEAAQAAITLMEKRELGKARQDRVSRGTVTPSFVISSKRLVIISYVLLC